MAKKNLNILIAEDEKPLSNALQLKLKSNGYDCAVASDGEQALSMLKDGKFDLLLLDLVMPKIDGFGVLNGIKDQKIQVKTIVLSNLSQPEDDKKVRELGAVHFFIKSDTQLNEIISYIKENI